MNRRPASITLIGWLFTVLGIVELVLGISRVHQRLANDDVLVLAVGTVALTGGILALRGWSLGRWLILAWLAFHVVISSLHAPFQLITHCLLLAVLGYFLLRPRASAYFHGRPR